MTLILFDFDQTLVPDDTDRHVVHSLMTAEQLSEIKQKMTSPESQWTDMMNWAVGEIHKNGTPVEKIASTLHDLQVPESLSKTLTKLKNDGHSLRIASDANTFFIDAILKHQQLDHLFDEVFSNPTQIGEEGQLTIRRFISPPDEHGCERCIRTPNMCKGNIIEKLHEKKRPSRTIYVGDGRNDFCPATKLTSDDVVLARKDYSLAKLLEETKIPAQYFIWESYEELSDQLLTHAAL
eukprot:m.78829 g.78829  ORF g.78829 m.78829 type:complete len:237 (-) comp20799_c0_seq3:142-852(-)